MSDLRKTLETTLGDSYSLERELGGGGMSRVFVAEEIALGRKVVVKVLGSDIAEGLSADRFVREIKLAARLQQANIVPVLRAGSLDGLPYYTMPYVAGESLRARMEAGSVSTSEAIAILRDVAKALSYAHTEGVVHRDIKPENVLLSAGTAVVTDFGIAKAISSSRSVNDTSLTSVGTSLGTPAYMAPEQVAGDPDTDARADLYSWGVMAYELLAGRHPFAHHKTAAALVKAQIAEMPEHVATRTQNAPLAISDLVMRCLAKSPDDRPASASDLLATLERTSFAVPVQTASRLSLGRALAIYLGAFVIVGIVAKLATTVIGLPTWVLPSALGVMALGLPIVILTGLVERQRGLPPSRAQTGALARMAGGHRFTWGRTRAGAIGVLALFALAVTGYMGMRQFGIGPFGSLIGSKSLAQHDAIVIADMRGTPNDSALGAVLVEGLRVGLAESKALRLISPERTRMTLQQMRRPDERLTPELARDVAVRVGAKAVLDGEVRAVGSAYAFTVRLLDASDGEPLATLQETANGDADFTAAAGRLSIKLRDRVGESLRSVNAAPALEDVTTASLPALRKYTEGQRIVRTGDYMKLMQLMREAIALDPGFVSAYRILGSTISTVSGLRQEQSAAMERAYQLRHKVTPVERAATEAAYWMNGPISNLDSAYAAARRAVDLAPVNSGALYVASLTAQQKRRYPEALEFAHRALAADSSNLDAYYVQALSHAEQGRLDSAQAVVRRLSAAQPNHPVAAVLTVMLANLAGNDSVPLGIALAMERTTSIPLMVLWGASQHRALAVQGGRIREATMVQGVASRAGLSLGARMAGLEVPLYQAYWQARFLGDSARAVGLLEAGLRAMPLDSIPPRERRYHWFAETAMWMRRPDLARKYLEEHRRLDPGARTEGSSLALPLIESAVAVAEHRYADALEAARRADSGGQPNAMMPRIASIFHRMGQKDSAIVYYERYLSSTSIDLSLFVNATELADARKRLGELYEERGVWSKAYAMYSAFVHQWRNADAELQPVVQEVRARMKKMEGRIR